MTPIRRLTLPGGPLTLAAASALERDARALREDRDVRVVLLDSAGADFCPGPPAGWDPLDAGIDAAAALAAVRCPTIAVLEGRVASLGLELALACDLRVAGAGATFAMPEIAAGRLPCWGATQRLPRAAGLPFALAVLFGEERGAEQAAAAGLVQVLAGAGEAAARAEALAERLLTLGPLALELVKEAVHRGRELPLRGGLELEGDLNHLLQATADRAEGLAAFAEKRPPQFAGR
jgi:enoyl-CoA hydratase/carnithine racemase